MRMLDREAESTGGSVGIRRAGRGARVRFIESWCVADASLALRRQRCGTTVAFTGPDLRYSETIVKDPGKCCSGATDGGSRAPGSVFVSPDPSPSGIVRRRGKGGAGVREQGRRIEFRHGGVGNGV